MQGGGPGRASRSPVLQPGTSSMEPATTGRREEVAMSPYRRVGRWVLVGAAVLVAGWVLLRVGVGVYLRTSAGRATVANKLQEMIGLPVEVTEFDLGSRSSIKFRVLEPAAGPS